MKLKMILLCGLLLVGNSSVFAADDDSDTLRAECMQMGSDEGLSGDELQNFVAQCMQDQGE